MGKAKNTYTLGASEEEQKRLYEQQSLYGDNKFLVFDEGSTVCEVGCGSGANLWIAALLKTGKFIGIDIQPEQIAACRRRAQELSLNNTEFHCVDGRELSLASNSVDAAFCRLVLIHLPDPLSLIKEMYRITRPGGKIIAIEPDVTAYRMSKPASLKCFKARVEYFYRPGHGSIQIASQLEDLFKKSGLEQVTMKKHEISVTGKEKEKLVKLLMNLLIMLRSCQTILLNEHRITQQDIEQAENDILELTEADYIYQVLWVAEGIKPS